jgi:hypothetical protein
LNYVLNIHQKFETGSEIDCRSISEAADQKQLPLSRTTATMKMTTTTTATPAAAAAATPATPATTATTATAVSTLATPARAEAIAAAATTTATTKTTTTTTTVATSTYNYLYIVKKLLQHKRFQDLFKFHRYICF